MDDKKGSQSKYDALSLSSQSIQLWCSETAFKDDVDGPAVKCDFNVTYVTVKTRTTDEWTLKNQRKYRKLLLIAAQNESDENLNKCLKLIGKIFNRVLDVANLFTIIPKAINKQQKIHKNGFAQNHPN